MAEKKTDRKIGHIQVDATTSKQFRDLKNEHEAKEKMGKVTSDRFMRLLLQAWEQRSKATGIELLKPQPQWDGYRKPHYDEASEVAGAEEEGGEAQATEGKQQ